MKNSDTLKSFKFLLIEDLWWKYEPWTGFLIYDYEYSTEKLTCHLCERHFEATTDEILNLPRSNLNQQNNKFKVFCLWL